MKAPKDMTDKELKEAIQTHQDWDLDLAYALCAEAAKRWMLGVK